MAKSIIKHILNITGIKSPDANGYYDPSVYKPESAATPSSSEVTERPKPQPAKSGPTRVEKYLASKNPEVQQAAEPEAAPAQSSELTGVAKYLARKQQELDEQAAAEAEALANMTGVARYIAQKEGRVASQTVSAPAPEPEPEEVDISKLTGVEKYLALQKKAAASPAPAKPKAPSAKPAPAPKAKAEEKPPVEAKPQVVEKPPVKAKAKAEEKRVEEASVEEAAPQAPTAGDAVVDLAADAGQCQAATTKGTQCRRKSGLETIEKTVNDQRYTFAVCSQHNNDGFTPVEGLLK